MVTVNPQLRCRLCDDTLDATTAPMHLRWVHQVLPGERTMVDVPVATNWQKPLENADRPRENRPVVASL